MILFLLSLIESIYLINLDHRTDRWEKSMEQLTHYNLVAQRVSAVNGKELPVECFEAVGVKYEPWMEQDWVHDFSHPEESELEYLRKDVVGNVFFSRLTSKGAVGCALSHLKVLRDALKNGYETIWVLEDDFQILQDPHLLDAYIHELDDLTGGDWDLLYTDKDELPEENFEINMEWQWRPDQPFLDLAYCKKRTIVNDHFTQIGYRHRTHSMILSRSGVKKVIEYFDHFGIFMPIDHELACIPNFKMYNLRDQVVTFSDDGDSDIQGRLSEIEK